MEESFCRLGIFICLRFYGFVLASWAHPALTLYLIFCCCFHFVLLYLPPCANMVWIIIFTLKINYAQSTFGLTCKIWHDDLKCMLSCAVCANARSLVHLIVGSPFGNAFYVLLFGKWYLLFWKKIIAEIALLNRSKQIGMSYSNSSTT